MNTISIAPGYSFASNTPSDLIESTTIGYGLVVVLIDPATRTVALANVAMPDSKISPKKAKELPGYFVDTAVPLLLSVLDKARGQFADRHFKCILVGGTNIVDPYGSFNLGDDNVIAVKELLRQFQLDADVEDVGGQVVRKITLMVNSGKVIVNSPGMEEKEIWPGFDS